MRNFLLSPPVAIAVFLCVAYGLYRLSGAVAARDKDAPGKHQPYACGEDLAVPEAQLTYHAFFKLALMFGILHLATLVIATLPAGNGSRWLATVYLVGIGISVLVLTEGEL
jgi:NADH:ubiquinone oxidoreductase subunit 3 (subunit A)